MFILIEQFKNADITTDAFAVGIEAKNFENAKEIIKNRLISLNLNHNIINDDTKQLCYEIDNGTSLLDDVHLTVFGELENRPLEVIKE